MLIYGLEVCPLRKPALKALDFVVDRFFMKLFHTSNMQVIRLSQRMLNFELPSLLTEKRSNKSYTYNSEALCLEMRKGARVHL